MQFTKAEEYGMLGVIYLSEKNSITWPRWILAGALLTPIAMFFLFRVPEADQQTQIAYVVAIFSFYMAVFGIFSVPYLAIASKLAIYELLKENRREAPVLLLDEMEKAGYKMA